MPDPLLSSLETEAHLSPAQAEGVLGMVLVQLRKLLHSSDFENVRSDIQEVDHLISVAPPMKPGGMLGGLAGSLGGDRGRMLAELNQGMKNLKIPTSRQREIVDTLRKAVETHHPSLVPLLEKLAS